jgi:hypothetical protein
MGILLLLLSTAPLRAEAAQSIYITQCGLLEVIGRIQCDREGCRLVVFKGSAAETAIELKSPRAVPVTAYDRQDVRARVNLKSRSLPLHGKLVGLEPVLSGEMPRDDQKVRTLAKEPCQP